MNRTYIIAAVVALVGIVLVIYFATRSPASLAGQTRTPSDAASYTGAIGAGLTATASAIADAADSG